MASKRPHTVNLFELMFFSSIVIALSGVGLALQIELKTKKYDGIVPKSIEITCIPEAKGNCARKILALQVSRKSGETLVTLEKNSEAISNPLLKKNLKVEGRIEQDVSKSRLSVTFNDVLEEDSGQYSCSMIYLDEWGSLKLEKATYNFTMKGYNMKDFVRYMMGKVDALENFQIRHASEMTENLAKQEELAGKLQRQENATAEIMEQLVEQGKLEERLQRQENLTAVLLEKLVKREDLIQTLKRLACSGEIYNEHKCYRKVDKNMTYDQAKIHCKNIGGNVAVPVNLEETSIIKGIVENKMTWIGITDEETEGKWVLENGSEVTWTNWFEGEPNNSGGEENCVELMSASHTTWNDVPCSLKVSVTVCEI